MDQANTSTFELVHATIVSIYNEMINAGINENIVMESINGVLDKYVKDGIKVKKMPVSKPKTQVKSKQKNTKVNLKEPVWILHPDDNNYSYTTGINIGKGFPLRNNLTRKVVMVIDLDSTRPLTIKDAKIAISYGLEIDYDSII